MDGQVSDSPDAIGKVIAVVEALATESKVSRIARATGLATSTVHRILQSLVQAGWAHDDQEHGYMLGPRLLAVTAGADDATFLVKIATPHLRELRDATGDTVHLAMRRGDEMGYVAKLDGRKAYQMRSHVGLTIPLHCTAVGKAILAATAVDEVRAMAARSGLPARTEHTITDVETLVDGLDAVRSQGYAVDEQENEASIRCVGAVVIGQRGQPVAGLSVSSLAYDLSGPKITRYAQLVILAARRISTALGTPLSWQAWVQRSIWQVSGMSSPARRCPAHCRRGGTRPSGHRSDCTPSSSAGRRSPSRGRSTGAPGSTGSCRRRPIPGSPASPTGPCAVPRSTRSSPTRTGCAGVRCRCRPVTWISSTACIPWPGTVTLSPGPGWPSTSTRLPGP
jgi:IclR family acetate operon transcriptional repressor